MGAMCDRNPKQEALMTAIQKGLIPKSDGMYDTKVFDKLWEIFVDTTVKTLSEAPSKCPHLK